MNTAPKLQHIEVLRQMQADFAASNGLTEEVVALDYAISAMQQAALAPPSGEGVELDHVRQRIELAIEHGDAHGWATARNELAGVLGSSCFTTPQSAPVDGDWRKFYSVEVKSDPPFPYGVAVITDANGEQSVHVHDDNPVLWHLLNKLTTPPPASQERGGDITCYVGDMKTSAGMRYYVCIERNGNTITPHEFGERYKAEYEVACWDAFFNDKPKPDILAYGPPSSAAESDGDPCIECGADPGEPCTPTCCAAEQAKPVGCSHCWGDRWMKDGTPCPACNPSGSSGHAHAEQAQAGERITTLPLWDELELEAAIHPNQYKANCLREAAALLRRLAGGVTVDDAMRERFKVAFHSRPNETRTYDEALHDALVAALGAK